MEKVNENILQIDIDTLFRGDKVLISDSEMNISKGEKIALIGRNGSGKSTLLDTIYKISTSQDTDDSVDLIGDLNILPEFSIGYLPQDIKLQKDQTVQECINEQMGEKTVLYKKYIEYTEDINTGKREYNEEYALILEKMERYSLWRYPEELESILEGFDIPSVFLERNIRSLSGGEATKIALISLLISKPDLILLDEPTNNLDLKNIIFLEEWFKTTPTSLLVVSHDRYFLDNVIETIWEIDEETQEIIRYGGNYSFYEEEKDRQFEGRMRSYEEQEKEKKRLQKDIKRLNQRANEFETSSNNDFYRAKGAKVAKTAKSRTKRIQRELEKLGEPIRPKLPKFVLGESRTLEGSALSVKDLSFGFDKNLFENIELKLSNNERIAITGSNGTGKSTLIKILAGKIPVEDEIIKNENLKIGYLPQSIIPENPNQDILSYMRQFSDLSDSELQETLGRVLFMSPLHLKVRDFSIGELKRIQLAIIFASDSNLLILDEPTNHLDILTLNMLEKTLNDYNGALIVVSHDREFLKRINIDRNLQLD